MKIKLLLIFVLNIFLLSACSLRPVSVPDVHYYQLTAVAQPNKINKTSSLTLLVSIPIASPGYQSSNMIYVMQPYQLQQFVKHRWIAPPAQMLLPLMVQSIQNTHYFHAVIAAPFAGNVDLRLDTQLLMLQQEFINNRSQIKLLVQANLINNISGKILATKLFLIIQPVTSINPYDGVVATNAATQQLLQQLAAFVVQNTH